MIFKIYEKCEGCGKRRARLVGDLVKADAHDKCPAKPPGPPNRPMTYNVKDVWFERGDFTVDELRAELDQAFAELDDFRGKFHRCRNAMREIEKTSTFHAKGSLRV